MVGSKARRCPPGCCGRLPVHRSTKTFIYPSIFNFSHSTFLYTEHGPVARSTMIWYWESLNLAQGMAACACANRSASFAFNVCLPRRWIVSYTTILDCELCYRRRSILRCLNLLYSCVYGRFPHSLGPGVGVPSCCFEDYACIEGVERRMGGMEVLFMRLLYHTAILFYGNSQTVSSSVG